MTSVSDDFNRADEALGDSANWDVVYESDEAFVVDDGPTDGEVQLETNVSAPNQYLLARWAGTAMATDDYDVTADIQSTTALIGVAIAGRIPESGTGSANADGYYGGLFGSDAYYIIELANAGGTENILASGGSPGTTEHEIRFNLDGSTLEIFVDGSGSAELSTTDATYAAGGVGLWWGSFGNDATGVSANLDNWSAADLVSPAGLVLPPWTHPRTNTLLRM